MNKSVDRFEKSSIVFALVLTMALTISILVPQINTDIGIYASIIVALASAYFSSRFFTDRPETVVDTASDDITVSSAEIVASDTSGAQR